MNKFESLIETLKILKSNEERFYFVNSIIEDPNSGHLERLAAEAILEEDFINQYFKKPLKEILCENFKSLWKLKK